MTGTEGKDLVDLHSHLIPGVDDGARTVEDALEGIARMVKVGVGSIVTTPHLDGSVTSDPMAFQARMAEVDAAWTRLSEVVAERFPELRLQRGHEVMLDTPDPVLTDPRVRLGGTDFVLVEWPRLQVPPGSTRAIARIRSADARPIVAHPERYSGMGPEMDLAAEWRLEGALLQVHHGSLVGRYGPRARERALLLLQRGWVDLLSSDFHGRSHLKLHIREAREVLMEWGGEEQWRMLTSVNPARVLDNEFPLPVPPLPLPGGLWTRVRSLFRSGNDGGD